MATLEKLLSYFEEEFIKWKESLEDTPNVTSEDMETYKEFQAAYDKYRLIFATAPVLLETLQNLVQAHEVKMGKSAVDLRVKLAQAAIAAATGEK